MGTSLGEFRGDRQINTVFTILAEGLTLCHLGDISQSLSPRQVEQLNQTEVLFVPVGGVCTITAAKVAELINAIGPRIVIPIHYHIGGVKVELDPLDGFLAEMGMSEIAPQVKLNVTASNLPRELQVVVLRREV